MEKLPVDVLNKFYEYLDWPDIGALAITCRKCLRILDLHKDEYRVRRKFPLYEGFDCFMKQLEKETDKIKTEKLVILERKLTKRKLSGRELTSVELMDRNYHGFKRPYFVTGELKNFLRLDQYGANAISMAHIIQYISAYAKIKGLVDNGKISLNKTLRNVFETEQKLIQFRHLTSFIVKTRINTRDKDWDIIMSKEYGLSVESMNNLLKRCINTIPKGSIEKWKSYGFIFDKCVKPNNLIVKKLDY